ncbi:MAG: aldose 1-epimerase family protein [Anaerolineae bacterium]|nr:aldose 1-epimerase family protein [Anaerolineae bacterium]
MPILFGQAWSRADLYDYMPDMSQVASVQRAVLQEGRAEGVSVIDFKTGSGFEFRVVPGRALDVAYASYNGIPLFWRPYPGQVAAAYFEPEGLGWLRGYAGGLTTGGLAYMGSPSVDQGEPLGIHGRVSYIPAYNVWADADWEGNTYRLWARGKVAESSALGSNLVMTREISTTMGASHFIIRDTVQNQTHERIEHMMLYHFNIGFPVLSAESRLLINSEEVVPRDSDSQAGLSCWDRFEPPLKGRPHQLFYHRLRPDSDGKAHVVLTGLVNAQPMAVYMSYNHEALPWFVNWKCMQAGNYVTGLEPANAWVEGRATERATGRLRFLEAWESVAYEVEFGVLTDADAIRAFTRQHNLPTPE